MHAEANAAERAGTPIAPTAPPSEPVAASSPAPEPTASVDSAAVERVIADFAAGRVFSYLRDDRCEHRAATLAAILEQVVADGTKIVWTGNPLRSALTIERLFLQAAGPGADLRVERTPAELADMLHADPQGRLEPAKRLIIVQQADTLDGEARETLSAMGPLLAGLRPPLAFLFCGGLALKTLPERGPEPEPELEGEPGPVPAPKLGPPPIDLLAIEPKAHRSRTEALPLVALVVVAVLGALLTESAQVADVAAEPAAAATTGGQATIAPTAIAPTATVPTATVPTATSSAPTPSAAPPPPSSASAAPPATRLTVDVDTLRREFDRFLAREPERFSSLTVEQRDRLFSEFMQHARKPQADRPL